MDTEDLITTIQRFETKSTSPIASPGKQLWRPPVEGLESDEKQGKIVN